METPLNSEDLRLKNGHGNVTDVSVPAIEITSIEPVYLKIETNPLPPDFDVKNPLVTASAVTLMSEKLDIKHESDSTSNLTCRQGGRKFYRSEARFFPNAISPTFGVPLILSKTIRFNMFSAYLPMSKAKQRHLVDEQRLFGK